MKGWRVAGAGLAAAAVLVVVVTVGMDTQRTDAPLGGGQAMATAAGELETRRTQRPAGAGRTSILLPAMTADSPTPLELTRGMLEQAWRDGEFQVRLADGERYRVALESERFEPGSQWTVVGRVHTRVGPQAMVLTFGPDAVFGVLPHPDGSLMQVTTSLGMTAIAAAGGMLPPGSASALSTRSDYVVPETTDRWIAAKASAVRAPDIGPSKASSSVEVVVLGLYTDDLVALRGSVSAAETEVTNLFAVANQSYVDSGTRVRLKVAGLKRIGIDPSLNNHDALYAITDNNVAGVDLASLRDEMAADLLALLRPHRDTHGTCGVAWLNGGGRYRAGISDHFGVSVSNVAPCGPHVLAHELGHNMGSAHDRETQSINGYVEYGVYPYSFGYRQDEPPAFATIMAYSSGQPWIGYFSNPSSNLCGALCGVEGRSDNVRSLNATAPVIAAFRGPPGTLSIVDAEIFEPEPGSTRYLVFPVRLSGTAPASGVRFDAIVSGGTAQVGTDYIAQATTAGMIPAGERETSVVIEVMGDAVKEPNETILLRLTNVVGATVHKGDAVGIILNDDPRPTLSGRIRFEGAPAPESEFSMLVSGVDGTPESTLVRLFPPDFAYSLPVVKGASLHFTLYPPSPFAILPFNVDDVESSTIRDIRLKKGVQVSGQITLPAGQPALTTPIDLGIMASIDGRYQPLSPASLSPPNHRYTFWVVPGAWVYLESTPPAPYARFMAVHTYVDSDLVQDIALSPLPALVIWGGGRVKVGTAGTHGSMQFVLQLSMPAPPGGVRLRYRTVDGTATAGSDYTAIQGTLQIAEGDTVAYTDMLEWFGDDEIEGDEDFYVVVSDVVGANPVVTRLRVILSEQERYMSEPLPPRLKN